MRSQALVLALLLCAPIATGAQERRAWSYTMQDMYERAQSLKIVVEKKKLPTEMEALVETSMKAAEFKGYVAALLDTGEDATDKDCAKVLPVNDLAYRTAALMTRDPLDRSRLAVVKVLITLRYICAQELAKASPR
jgi:hypothetical protein